MAQGLPPSLFVNIRVLLALALAALSAASFAADTNILLGKSVKAINGTVTHDPNTITDGIFLPRGQAWYDAVCWNPESTGLEIDLNGLYSISKMSGQFDDNEAYRIEYLGKDNLWRTAWNVPNADFDAEGHDLHGMQTRPSFTDNLAWYTLPTAITASKLRVFGVNGDNAYAVGEIRAAGEPVPEPATMAALGLGAVASLRRRWKARSAKA